MKLLIVGNDSKLSKALYKLLHGVYKLSIIDSHETALNQIDNDNFDLIIIDNQLPDIKTDIFCQTIREAGVTAPVLILGEQEDSSTIANLLDIGANDFIKMPVDPKELLARIRTLLRISHQANSSTLKHNGLILDLSTRVVVHHSEQIKLRRKEFDLLECLFLNINNVVHHEILARYVWDQTDITNSTLQVHINNLRQKIDKPFGTNIIKTVHGIGYVLGDIYNTLD